MDDIVIFSKTLDEHIRHLREVSGTLQQYNIAVSPITSFIGYLAFSCSDKRWMRWAWPPLRIS